MKTTSAGLRLALFTLAASTSLSGLAAQTAPMGRPVRGVPNPAATPTPAPTPAPVKAPTVGTVKAPTTAPATAPAAKPAAGPVAMSPVSLSKVDPNAFKLPKVPLTMIIPPSSPALKPIAGTTLLTGRSFEDTISKLPVARKFTSDQLRANPRITIGASEIDLTPMLKDPRALTNVAQRMRAMSSLITLEADTIEAAEIKDRGLALKSIVTYRLKPGACDNPANRAKLATVMVRCFDQQTDAQIDATFSDPASPRYFSGRTREMVITSARKQRAEMQAKINERISEMRIRMKEPQLRKDLVAGAGDAEVTRLSAMSDAALTRELINQGRFKIEDSLFIPQLDASDLQEGKTKNGVAGSNPQAGQQADNGDVSVTAPVPPMKFLTGFTLGREYEWQLRIEATIPWCLVGCEETYYAEAYAGFGAGLGLRLPFEVTGTYKFERVNNKETATFTPAIATVNADNAFYSAVQLPSEKHFQGQELLAKFGAWAGLRADLPIVGDFTIGVSKDNPLGVDFTADLPGDFKNGQFTPPLPCPPGAGAAHPCKKAPTFVKDFDNLDLTGGIANIGIAGVKVFPFVKGELFSKGLTVTLADKLKPGAPVQVISATEQGKPYALGFDANTKASTFVIGEPSYNLGMKLTPGITARLFIDLAVWGTHWDFDVELPQLGIEVPKGGKNFSCHEDTLCDRTVTISPDGVKKVVAQLDSAANKVQSWNSTAYLKWKERCRTEVEKQCANDLFLEVLTRNKEMKAKIASDPKYKLADAEAEIKSAEQALRAIVLRPYVREDADWIASFASQCAQQDNACKAYVAERANAMRNNQWPGVEYESHLSVSTVRELVKDPYFQAVYFRTQKSQSDANKK